MGKFTAIAHLVRGSYKSTLFRHDFGPLADRASEEFLDVLVGCKAADIMACTGHDVTVDYRNGCFELTIVENDSPQELPG